VPLNFRKLSQLSVHASELLQEGMAQLPAVLRILIFTHSGSRISDPKQQQKRGVKKNLLSNLFWSHKFHKIDKLFYFLNAEEKKFGRVFKEL
jgi:hypothetical protein